MCLLGVAPSIHNPKKPHACKRNPPARPAAAEVGVLWGCSKYSHPRKTPTSAPAPVRPPPGLPSNHFWGFLPCVSCLISDTFFGASLLAALARMGLLGVAPSIHNPKKPHACKRNPPARPAAAEVGVLWGCSKYSHPRKTPTPAPAPVRPPPGLPSYHFVGVNKMVLVIKSPPW